MGECLEPLDLLLQFKLYFEKLTLGRNGILSRWAWHQVNFVQVNLNFKAIMAAVFKTIFIWKFISSGQLPGTYENAQYPSVDNLASQFNKPNL